MRISIEFSIPSAKWYMISRKANPLLQKMRKFLLNAKVKHLT